eukprot:1535453-Rhodomonas_salina.2
MSSWIPAASRSERGRSERARRCVRCEARRIGAGLDVPGHRESAAPLDAPHAPSASPDAGELHMHMAARNAAAIGPTCIGILRQYWPERRRAVGAQGGRDLRGGHRFLFEVHVPFPGSMPPHGALTGGARGRTSSGLHPTDRARTTEGQTRTETDRQSLRRRHGDSKTGRQTHRTG